MSQYPPTGPSDEPSSSRDGTPPSAGTPAEAGDQPTETFSQSPYDVPEAGPSSDTAAYPTASYGQAPDPGRTIYSETSTVDPAPQEDADGGRPRWVVPVVVAVVALLVAGGVVAALILGGDDEDPLPPPTAEPSVTATTTPGEPSEEPTSPDAPTQEPTTEAPTTPEATTEPTAEAGELISDLEESVAVGDLTFELADGFTTDEGLVADGATEAVRGTFVSGDEEIEMLATLWPSNEEADDFAARVIDGLEGVVEVETGDTFTNGMGTYWAFASDDRTRGAYIWTTDRGHVLEVVGGADYLAQFYSNHPL